MVNVTFNVAKTVLAAGVTTGIIILATKVNAEGAKEVLCNAAKATNNDPRIIDIQPIQPEEQPMQPEEQPIQPEEQLQ